MYAKISVGLLLLTLVGCYMPTRERVCEDLRRPSNGCRGNVSLRTTLLAVFPAGTPIADVRRTLRSTFVEHDPLTELHDNNEGVELLAPDVSLTYAVT
jgi:hypothetical protein